jgi:hypothetical protein
MTKKKEENPYIKQWGKQLYETYKVQAAALREASRKLAQQCGRNGATLEYWRDRSEGVFCIRSKMGMGTSFKINDELSLGLSVDSCHYGFSDDKIELSLYRDKPVLGDFDEWKKENQFGTLEFRAKCRKLDYNKIADILRQAADAIDRDQYMRGANTDFAILDTITKNQENRT